MAVIMLVLVAIFIIALIVLGMVSG